MTDTRSLRLARVIQCYYWMTPLFLFASWRYGFDARVPFLDAIPGARMGYYGLSFACAWLVAVRPSATAIVGRLESTLAASLLILTTWVAYFRMIESAASETGPLYNPFTPEAATSLALSACVFIASSLLQRIEHLRAA